MEDPSKESLVESRENLDCRDGDSLALKTDPSKESLGSIYRAVRTINGARGIPEASTLDSVTYVGEALLRLLRAGTPCATPAIIASLSVMMEGVREMRAHIDSAGGEAGKNRSALSAPPADGLEAFSAPLRVFQVMTREVMTLSPDKSFYEAVALMAHRSFRHLLVVDAEKRLRGVISDRDVLRALARTLNWNSASVSEIMMSIAIPATRHGVHQDPTAIGCRTMSVTLTTPSGTTRTPKNATIHGIVRHRRLSPMKPIRLSTR